MARRLDDVTELVKTHPDKGRSRSKLKTKPSKAIVHSAGPKLPRPVLDHEKAERHLTSKWSAPLRVDRFRLVF